MREQRKERIKIITDAPEEFEKRVNEFLDELTSRGAEVDLKVETNPLMAVIHYEETVFLPECISDKYELRGMGCKCESCEYFTIPDDKRLKRGFCELHEEVTWRTSPACDEFYLEFEEFKQEIPFHPENPPDVKANKNGSN